MKFTAVTCYQLWTTLLILTACSRSKGQECSSVEPLVTGNTYRIMDNMIRASSSLNSSHTPNEARLPNGDGWCSEQLLGINDPWLEVDFERNVIVYSISVAGNDISYVSQYRIEYAAMEDDEMQFVLTDTEEPKIFNIESAEGNISSQALPSPIEAQRLRILPYTWSSNPPCLRLELHGCLLEPDSSSYVTLPITTEVYYNPKATKSAVITLVSTSRILPTVSVYPGGAGDGGVVVEVRKDYLVVEIVVPILVLAVFVVVVVCVTGVVICCRLKRTADYKLKLLTPPAIRYISSDDNSNTTVGESTIKVVHNSLYSRQVEGNRESTNVALFPNMSYKSAQPTTGDLPQSNAGCEYETLRPGTSLPPNVVPEGYEGVDFIPPGSDMALSAPAGLHEYESIRLSKMTSQVTAMTRNSGGGKPAVLTTSVQSSEYELMESARHGEEEAGHTVSATNPRYMNVMTPEISVEEGDFSMSVSTLA